MIINGDYKANPTNYIKTKTEKQQIVLGNIYNYDRENFMKSLEMGGANKCPHFTIDRAGKIFQHIDIKYFSRYISCKMDEFCISIGLYNLGHIFDKSIGDFDIFNNQYDGELYTKKWKDCNLWQPYTKEQQSSTVELTKYLLEQTNISQEVIPMNVCKQDINIFNGICYRSNHNIKHYDLNPSWDFKNFKKIIENG